MHISQKHQPINLQGKSSFNLEAPILFSKNPHLDSKWGQDFVGEIFNPDFLYVHVWVGGS